jgi:hypothetical protein
MTDAYSFCESVAASGRSPWHIRRVTDKGRKLSGGADTPTLCGRDLHGGWDLSSEITELGLSVPMHTCQKCAEAYRKEMR